MKYCVGAILMMGVCLVWLQFRYLPQQRSFENALIQCDLQRAILMSQNMDDTMRLSRAANTKVRY